MKTNPLMLETVASGVLNDQLLLQNLKRRPDVSDVSVTGSGVFSMSLGLPTHAHVSIVHWKKYQQRKLKSAALKSLMHLQS